MFYRPNTVTNAVSLGCFKALFARLPKKSKA